MVTTAIKQSLDSFSKVNATVLAKLKTFVISWDSNTIVYDETQLTALELTAWISFINILGYK